MSSRKVREMLRQKRIEFDMEMQKYYASQELNQRLDSMTKAQLVEYAEENGIEIDKTAKKAEILGKLK